MRAFVPTVLAIALAGCSGGLRSDAPPTHVYVLRATANVEPVQLDEPLGALQIGRPQTYPGLESERIVLVQSDHRMSHYAASRWADDVPDVVEALALEVLRRSGAWSSVFDSRAGFAPDYFLQIVVRRFEADYTNNASRPEVHVSFTCTVARRSDRRVLASFDAEGMAVARENRLGTVVAAFEQAAAMALATVSERTLEAVLKSQNVESPDASMKRYSQ